MSAQHSCKKILILLILCLSLVLECSAQIRCYVCSTQSGEYASLCGDNFRLQSINAYQCEGTCQKTRGYRDEGGRRVVEVTRSCVQYTGDGCKSGPNQGISADICTCNEELCNHGEKKQISAAYLATALIVNLILFLLSKV
ncbi:hypothetical protein DPMN_115464 [Dreissena polymorpha]|uniref:Protein quiver n=1 Tax=Dreissena polymorpha TaxID=45954 RepID=A0A9D4KMH9_DREPO|nr:hypothetical protein DPMN_115464 [Dreissena polymorpha]